MLAFRSEATLPWEPAAPAGGDPEDPLEPWLDAEEGLLLDDEDWLEELLEDELELEDEELLLEEDDWLEDWLEELLEEELLLDDEGLDGVGMLGDGGVVGLLALGQPDSTKAQALRAIAMRNVLVFSDPSPIGNVIGPAKSFRLDWHAVVDARPKRCLA